MGSRIRVIAALILACIGLAGTVEALPRSQSAERGTHSSPGDSAETGNEGNGGKPEISQPARWLQEKLDRLERDWKERNAEPTGKLADFEALLRDVPGEARPALLLLIADAYVRAYEEDKRHSHYFEYNVMDLYAQVGQVPKAGSGAESGTSEQAGDEAGKALLPLLGDSSQCWEKVSKMLDEAFAHPSELVRISGTGYARFFPEVRNLAPDCSLMELLVREACRLSGRWLGTYDEKWYPSTVSWEGLWGTWPEFLDAADSLHSLPWGRGLEEMARWIRELQTSAPPSLRLRAELTRIGELCTISPERYKERFRKTRYEALLKEYGNLPGMGECYSELAKILRDQGNYVEALRLAEEGDRLFPGKDGDACRRWLNDVSTDFSVSLPPVVSPDSGCVPVHVHYENVMAFYARVSRADWREELAPGGRRVIWRDLPAPSNVSSAVWVGKVTLPEADIRQSNTATVTLPAFPPGYYRVEFVPIQKKPAGSPAKGDPQKCYETTFQVSKLVLFQQKLPRRRSMDSSQTCSEKGRKPALFQGYALEGENGDPATGVKAELWSWTGEGVGSLLEEVDVDSFGSFSFKTADSGYFRVRLRRNGEEVVGPIFSDLNEGKESFRPHAVLLTDRLVYSPGQTVHFKCIRLSIGSRSGKVVAEKGTPVTVYLRDRLRKQVGEVRLETDIDGCASGTLTIPDDGLPGDWFLGCNGGYGNENPVRIWVEPNRQPTFEVHVEASAGEREEDFVTIRGQVRYLTGKPVANARVWCLTTVYWMRVWNSSEHITRETSRLVTDGEGRFHFRLPRWFMQSGIDMNNSNMTCFCAAHVRVEAMDSTGEIQQGAAMTYLADGGCRLALNVPGAAMAGPVPLNLATEDVMGHPVSCRVRLRLFRLLPEEDRPSYKWASSRQIGSETMTIPEDGKGTWVQDLVPGAYRVEAAVERQEGGLYWVSDTFQVWPTPGSTGGVVLSPSLGVDRVQAQVGDVLTIRWAASRPDFRAILEVVHKGRIVHRELSRPNASAHAWSLPVTPELAGGFQIRLVEMTEEGPKSTGVPVSVPDPQKSISLKVAASQPVLVPGEPASIRVTWVPPSAGPGAMPAKAELMAVLYNASLDDAFPDNILPQIWDPGELLPEKWSKDSYEVTDDLNNSDPDSWGRALLKGRIVKILPGENCRPEELFKNLDSVSPPSSDVEVISEPIEDIAWTAVMIPDNPGLKRPEESSGVKLLPSRNRLVFFSPHVAVAQGETVEFPFALPEPLTRWRFLALAYTAEGATGAAETTLEASRDYMTLEGWPRFLRPGDQPVLTARFLNGSTEEITASARMEVSAKEKSTGLLEGPAERVVKVPAGGSALASWQVTVPERSSVIRTETRASSGSLHDGEDRSLRVLGNQAIEVQSVPLRFDGQGSQAFSVPESWSRSGSERQGVLVRGVKNPARLAVESLSLLGPSSPGSTDQLFDRYFALTWARKLVEGDSVVESLFWSWLRPEAGENAGGKTSADTGMPPEESAPCCRALRPDGDSWRNMMEHLADTEPVRAARSALMSRQLPDGSWEWFPGMGSDRHMTEIILQRMGWIQSDSDEEYALLVKKTADWAGRTLQRIWEQKRGRSWASLREEWEPLLLARSNLGEDFGMGDRLKEMLEASVEIWQKDDLKTMDPGTMARIALAAERLNEYETVDRMVEALEQRQKKHPDGSVGWPGKEGDSACPSVSSLAAVYRVWTQLRHEDEKAAEVIAAMLGYRQGRGWPREADTLEVAAALLGSDDGNIAETAELTLRAGDRELGRLGGSGHQTLWLTPEELGSAPLSIEKKDEGSAWGIAEFVRMRPVADRKEVDPQVRLTRRVTWLRRGKPMARDGKPGPGDEALITLIVRTPKALEHVRVTDPWAAGLEPDRTLSGLCRAGDTQAWVTHKDSSTDFYCLRLEPGEHLLQYRLLVRSGGRYTAPPAELQTLCAPECHARSAPLTISLAPPFSGAQDGPAPGGAVPAQ